MSDFRLPKQVIEHIALIAALVIAGAIVLFAPSGIPTVLNVSLAVIATLLGAFLDRWWIGRGTKVDVLAGTPIPAVARIPPAILLEGESEGDFTDTTIENHPIAIRAKDSAKVKSKKLRVKK